MDAADEPQETELSGGNMEPVVRIGDTVRRVAGPWTPAVHTLLAALRSAGMREVPEVRGFDAAGREVLGFLPGTMLVDAPPEVLWSSSVLDQAGRLLRRVHEASVALATEPGRIWRAPVREPVEVVCHNDVAPYNLVVDGGRVTGLIDFDFAAPGPRLRDLGYLAYRLAPIAEDAEGYDARRTSEGEDPITRVRRLIVAYDLPYGVGEVLAAAADHLDDLAAFTEARAVETGRDDFAGHAAMYRRDVERLRAMLDSRVRPVS
ncbi:phosphotransferase [Agromyces italicus]|uniref:phosphotransferase n=1 Tax=Agromyces italicus TaxID=279572 RepID=UPI0003B715D6|nr:phosphotransferase [Agromyces italicus]